MRFDFGLGLIHNFRNCGERKQQTQNETVNDTINEGQEDYANGKEHAGAQWKWTEGKTGWAASGWITRILSVV